jgi:7-carboxy-7-deazaguanine synthase
MIVKQLIAGNPTFNLPVTNPAETLEVAEFFYDTIQGEGINIGQPATFLRLQHCSLDCIWCDTQEVWRYGNPYTFDDLFKLMENEGVIDKLESGQHLVLTGGSPLRQQYSLYSFIVKFIEIYEFKPYIEIENECTIQPMELFANFIDCWNNSSKLSSSENPMRSRYKPIVLSFLSNCKNSWFKFVISEPEDWEEIQMDFIDLQLIKKEQIILMPKGATRSELEKNREIVIEMAVKHNVRFTDRLHITVWDKKTGI